MNLQEAVALARRLEAVAVEFDMHVGLTGGCLYKDGDRKDADFVFYSVRKEAGGPFEVAVQVDVPAFLAKLAHEFILCVVKDCGFVVKATTPQGGSVDLLFPERDGSYEDPVEVDEPPSAVEVEASWTIAK